MAGQGPAPKPAGARARRNRKSTRGTIRVLPVDEVAEREIPKLPPLPRRAKAARAWHPRVRAWWKDLWASTDLTDQLLEHERSGGLLMLARLYQAFWADGDMEAAAQIRLNEQRMGLDPTSRARLQQEVDLPKGAEFDEDDAAPTDGGEPADDPRKALRLVK